METIVYSKKQRIQKDFFVIRCLSIIAAFDSFPLNNRH